MRQVLARGRKRMVAVDPGGTTGWVLFEPDGTRETWGGYGVKVIDWGEQRDQQDLCDQLWKWNTARLKTERLDGIVIERFIPRAGVRTWEPEAVEIAGFCRWLMRDDPSRLFFQSPADAKSFGTDTKLHRYIRGWDPPFNVGRGGAGHAIDALRHSILWTCTRWAPDEERAA